MARYCIPPTVQRRTTTVTLKANSRMRLGEMLRLYRTVRGQSLREIAPQIGIGHATLMRIETGQAFDADTLLKLWTWMLAEESRIPRR